MGKFKISFIEEMKTTSRLLLNLVIQSSIFVLSYQIGVLGFDFGSSSSKIAIISPGKGFVLVENESSKTQTPNAISFLKGDRFFESSAVDKQTKIKGTENTFTHIFKYFGKRNVEDNEVNERRNYSYDVSNMENYSDDNVEGIQFNLKGYTLPKIPEEDNIVEYRVNKKETKLRFEEIAAMILEHTRELSDRFGHTTFPEAVYTVPPWWGPAEREQLMSIGELAGIYPLGFTSENTGSVLNYVFDNKKDRDPLNLLVYNMGAESTKLSLVHIEGIDHPVTGVNNTLHVVKNLAESWDKNLGGFEFDICLAEMIADKFDTKYAKPTGNPSIKKSAKLMHRVIKEGTKTREFFSSNKSKRITIDDLAYDQTYIEEMTREDFESHCQHLFDRVTAPIEQLLKTAGLTTKDVDMVQIIGGAVVYPKIKKLIEDYMGQAPKSYINNYDSMALGTSLMAANSTSTYRVALPQLYDGPEYQTNIQFESLDEKKDFKKRTTIFKRKERYGKKSYLEIPHSNDMVITLTVPNISGDVSTDNYKIKYEITGVNEILNEEKYKDFIFEHLKIKFALSKHGIPSVTGADLILSELVESAPEKSTKDTDKEAASKGEIEDSTNENSEKNDQEKTEENSEQKSDTESNTEGDKKETEKKEDEQKTTEDTEVSKTEMKKRKSSFALKLNRVEKVPKAYNENKKLVSESKYIQKIFKTYDVQKKREQKCRYELGTLSSDKVPDMLKNDQFLPFITDEEFKDLKSMPKELTLWLEEEAQFAEFGECDKRYDAGSEKQRMVLKRKTEFDQRENLVQAMDARITQVTKNIEEMKNTRPWIPAEKITAALEAVEGEKKWLDDKVTQQELLKKNENPVLLSKELKEKAEKIKNQYDKLRLIKKPVDKKDKAASKEKPKTDKDGFDSEKMEDLFKNFKGSDKFTADQWESLKKAWNENEGKDKSDFEELRRSMDDNDAMKKNQNNTETETNSEAQNNSNQENSNEDSDNTPEIEM